MLHNMHYFDRKKDEGDSCASCLTHLTQGCNQNNFHEFGVEVVADYHRVENFDDAGLASDYSLYSSMVVDDEALVVENSLEDIAEMDEASFAEDSLDNFHLDDGLALAVVDNLGNSSSQNCNKKMI